MRAVVAGAMSWPWRIVAIGLFSASLSVSADPVAGCRQVLEQLYPEPSANECSAGDDYPVELRPILDSCPEQAAALLEHAWAPLLARDEDNLLLADLSGLHQSFQSYAGQPPPSAVDPGILPGVLAELEKAPEPQPSWWELAWRRLLRWLSDNEREDSPWFEKIFVGESVTKTILYGSIALLVLLALGIVAMELRVGLAGRRSPVRSGWRDAGMLAQRPPGFEDLAGLPMREQPRLLLRLVLARLEAANILHLQASATHRNITAAVRGLEQGEAVASISAAAERSTFGDWNPSADEITLLREQGWKVCHALGEVRA